MLSKTLEIIAKNRHRENLMAKSEKGNSATCANDAGIGNTARLRSLRSLPLPAPTTHQQTGKLQNKNYHKKTEKMQQTFFYQCLRSLRNLHKLKNFSYPFIASLSCFLCRIAVEIMYIFNFSMAIIRTELTCTSYI